MGIGCSVGVVVGLISVFVSFWLFKIGLISYEQSDFGSTAAISIGTFVAIILILVRSKNKETLTAGPV